MKNAIALPLNSILYTLPKREMEHKKTTTKHLSKGDIGSGGLCWQKSARYL